MTATPKQERIWQQNRHTPMKALYAGRYQKLVGYQCQHCNGLFTPAGHHSRPHVMLPPTPGAKRVSRPNKAHKVRVGAS